MLTILLLVFSILPRVFATSCPAGGIYDSNFNKCYIYYSQPQIFLAAESTCRSIGGNLAEIRNEAVAVLSNGTIPSAYWIGANLLMAPRWTWTTNDTASYTNWAADQPADPSSFECASVGTENTNLWRKELCYSSRPFVCTSNPIDTPAPGYIHYGTQCFKMFDNPTPTMPLNYFDSELFCRLHENASLPKIPSQGVQDFVYSVVYNENKIIWLGLGCWGTGKNNCWWVDGSLPTYFNYWPGSPVASFPLYMRLENGQWYSENVFAPVASAIMCEKPARPT